MGRSGITKVLAGCCFLLMCTPNPVDHQTDEPSVSFIVANQTANESATDEYSSTELQLIASLSSPVDSAVTVFFTVSGSADSGVDFSVTRDRFVFSPGSTLCTTTVVLLKDTSVEPAETAVFTLSAPVNARLGAGVAATVVIEDKPVVNMSFEERTVSRRSGQFAATALLSQLSPVEVTVPYTVSGTAANPADHNLTAGVFVFPAGDTTSTKVVSVVNDSLEHEFRNLVISLGKPSGALRGDDSTSTVIIAYDPIVSYQLLDNELPGWTLSPYDNGFRVVTGEDFFTVINGGAQIFFENNYTIALAQNMIARESKELNFMAIEFSELPSVDSVFNAKTKSPSPEDPPLADVAIPGYDTATALGYYSIEAITVFARFGTTYFEVVVKGFSENAQLLEAVRQVLDTLKSRLH